MMQIPVILVVLLMGVAWLLAVICFEAGYQALKRRGGAPFAKGSGCRLWWIFLSVCALLGGVGQFLLSLPFLGMLGICHCALAETKDDVITVSDVLRNIPAALREFAGKLKPYLK